MSKNTGDGELLKYFWPFPYPEHKPPIEVIFTNGVPESDDPDHMVFQIPYNAFEQAIKKYAAQEANNARLDEATAIRKQFHGHRFGISEFMNNRIEELQNLTKEKESSDG